MHLHKSFLGALGAAAVALMTTGVASADTIAQFSSTNAPGSTVATFTGGQNGVFSLNPVTGVTAIANQGALIDTTAMFVISPLTGTGPAVLTDSTLLQPLSGGSFTIKDADSATVYLTGSFGAARLTGTLNNESATVLNIGDLSNLSGTFLGAGPYMNTAFSISMSGINPAVSLSGNGFAAFSATGIAGTFSGTPAPAAVPEPGSVAFAGVSGLGLLGLMVRGRRRGRFVA